MEWVETTGRSIEEAKDAALDQLGVEEQEAEFEILEEPRTGLFGRIRGEARIRARIRPARPRPKVERRDRGRRRERRGKTTDAKTSDSKGGDAANGEAPADTARGRSRSRSTTGADSSGDDAVVAVSGAESEPAGSRPRSGGGQSGGRRSRGGRPSGGRGRRSGSGSPDSGRSSAEASEVAGGGDEHEIVPGGVPEPVTGENDDVRAEGASAAEGRAMSDDAVSVEEQADLTSEFLTGLLDAFGLKGSLDRVEVDEDTIEVRVNGDDLGLLIGPKGQTLLAVQDLSRTYVQRKATGHHEGRVRIDVGGYRQRRREALERFALRVAAEVAETGVQKALEPMAAGDRKVVHDVVNGIDGVRTISEGEDPRRRVVIVPA